MVKNYFSKFCFIFFICGCTEKVQRLSSPITTVSAGDLAIDVYDFDGLKPFLEQDDEALHVVNFWATWCKPCIEELPYFELIGKRYGREKVQVMLVSLDFPSGAREKLLPFIKKHRLQNQVVLLDDQDANYWISRVDKDWSGAIPATLIYKKNKRKFFEKSFTYNELEKEVKAML